MSKQPKASALDEAPTLPPVSAQSNSHVAPSTVLWGGEHLKAPTPPPQGPAPDPGPAPKCPRYEEARTVARHRFLSPAEWGVIARGIGGIRDRERQMPVHPTSWWWPPKGMSQGLYKDAVAQRTKYFYLYHASSSIRWILMLLQLFIGAALTSLGSMSFRDGTPITVLGAANTVIAGLLAFLQNSGLPDRYRYDKAEFEAVEDHIKELLESGIAPADQAADQILAECFELYQGAKATVSSNLPANYNSRLGQQAAQRNSTMVQPGSHLTPKSAGLPHDGEGATHPAVGK